MKVANIQRDFNDESSQQYVSAEFNHEEKIEFLIISNIN